MTTKPPPLLLVLLGDSPRQPSGLGRIARDLAEHLAARAALYQYTFWQLGWEDLGADLTYTPSWDFSPFPQIGEDWAAGQTIRAIDARRLQLGLVWDQVILLTVWDPARCFEYRNFPGHKWGYFAIDGHDTQERFGGPAAETVRHYDRVLAYTEYGAKILHNVLDQSVQYLPHGHWWNESMLTPPGFEPPLRNPRLLGCVATNQPRKDLRLFFETLAMLHTSDQGWEGWLHADRLITGTWSLPQLAEEFSTVPVQVTLQMPEPALIERYQSCAVTLCVGRGEGFGYPIVESLACGTPVAAYDYAGGAHLIPESWRFDPIWMAYDNPYGLGRPYTSVNRVVAAIHRAMTEGTEPYCQGRVSYLHWSQLWPRWESWVRKGLTRIREGMVNGE